MDTEASHLFDDLVIRPAAADDLPAVGEIYNHYVLHSTCTFAEAPEGPTYWQNWLIEHGDEHPAFVAMIDGRLVGWGCLSPWNSRCAYRKSVEDSVYVCSECHKKGIGRVLLESLVSAARTYGHRNVIAQIADHQASSEALHRHQGFLPIGCLEGVGYKFGRWIDVTIWQLQL